VNSRLFGEVVVTMLVILDPPGNVPIFLAVTRRLSARERHRAAYLATATAFLVVSIFAVFGQTVLDYLNVSVPALQVSGGLLLLLVALQLLYGKGAGEDGYAEATPEQRTSIAMVPLGTPLLAGPGAIVATILFVRQSDTTAEVSALALGIVLIHVTIYLVMRYSVFLANILKPTGILVLTRIAGLLLAAIAVELVAAGVFGFIDAHGS